MEDLVISIAYDYESQIHKDLEALDAPAPITIGVCWAFNVGGPIDVAYPSATAGAGKIDKAKYHLVEGQISAKAHATPVDRAMMLTITMTQAKRFMLNQ